MLPIAWCHQGVVAAAPAVLTLPTVWRVQVLRTAHSLRVCVCVCVCVCGTKGGGGVSECVCVSGCGCGV